MASSFDTENETPEMENLASLAENLVYRLPGCSDVMIRKTLQEAYRDFCRRSCCLNGRRQFTISAEEPDVVVSPIFGGAIDSIAEVRYNRRVLGGRDYMVLGNRIVFHDTLVPEEGCEESQLPYILVSWIEMPKINSEQMPQWFMQQYGDALCSGVLSRLMSMSGKAWTDMQQAADERLRYENAVCEARFRYYGGNRNGNVGSAVAADDLI